MTLSDAVSLLGRDRAAFLAAYDALSPTQRSFHPPDGGWTADEVVQHLAKSEMGTLAIVQKQTAAGDGRRDVGLPDEAKLAAVEAFLRSDGRTTMPEASAPHIAPTDAASAEWRGHVEAFQPQWDAFAETFPPALADAGVMAHPRAGAITAAGAARFMAAHLEHHTRQLGRLGQADGFSA